MSKSNGVTGDDQIAIDPLDMQRRQLEQREAELRSGFLPMEAMLQFPVIINGQWFGRREAQRWLIDPVMLKLAADPGAYLFAQLEAELKRMCNELAAEIVK